MPVAGDIVELAIEKPASGGRMIARHDGLVLLVRGAIPGERVRARVERAERTLAFADVVEILESSPDRRPGLEDPLCGGCVFSHIAYPRQLLIKSELIADAFVRLGKLPLQERVDVAGSPETGYRMRARLHARDGRIGSYREGTHELCDAAPGGQLLPETLAAARALADAAPDAGIPVSSIQITENLPASQRAAHLELPPGAPVRAAALGQLIGPAMQGVTARSTTGAFASAGTPAVADSVSALSGVAGAIGELQRHPESFFQANRHLLPSLVRDVLDAVPASGDVLDLYAGVGLFSIALAGTGRGRLTAVEGDRSSGADLERNARPFGGALRVVVTAVEAFAAREGLTPSTILVDPPRTGISKAAMTAVVGHRAPRVVYVSCDPPTMARDARRLVDGGYALAALRAYDLFPNTPHVECLGVFDLAD